MEPRKPAWLSAFDFVRFRSPSSRSRPVTRKSRVRVPSPRGDRRHAHSRCGGHPTQRSLADVVEPDPHSTATDSRFRIASTASWAPTRVRYTCVVSLTLEWPSASRTTYSGAPERTRSTANACRSPVRVHPPLDARLARQPGQQVPDVGLAHRPPGERAEERRAVRNGQLPARGRASDPGARRCRRPLRRRAACRPCPRWTTSVPESGSKSLGARASASPIRRPQRQQTAISARFRTPVGARLEHCFMRSSISAPVRRSASSFEPLRPFSRPPLGDRARPAPSQLHPVAPRQNVARECRFRPSPLGREILPAGRRSGPRPVSTVSCVGDKRELAGLRTFRGGVAVCREARRTTC